MHDFFAVPAPVIFYLKGWVFFIGLEAKRYLFCVGLAFAGWWWWRRQPHRRGKLQAALSSSHQLRREIACSLTSIVIFSAISVLILALYSESGRFFYQSIDDYGWPYFFLSFILMMLVQDTYFYWTHRLMHQRGLFRYFHRTHHLSTNPNPWSTYAISPLEAIVDTGGTILILFFMPKHVLAYFVFLWFNTAYAVYGHLGYEILPRQLARHWLGRWINSSVAHNTHHAKARYNYGWYFLFWDRIMGTVDPNYETQYDEAWAKQVPAIRQADTHETV